jgi:ABC-type nitrate/sulfonate/bicarbonate transport system ATPase subunit/ABC-type transporter Mla maintaining outer membrane lipid asymmetry permease subunit MlaE
VEPTEPQPRLAVRGLKVTLPGGRVLIEDLSLEVAPGEVVVLLGGSGAGKSTLSRVLFERARLERAGFRVEAAHIEVDARELGLVPQRGALFDHLDVRGNLDLALRYGAGEGEPGEWLERVGLERELARPGVDVASLSGGQAQRVAVARVLAGGRQLLFLDEPSVGLDPHRVRMLARLVRQQVERPARSEVTRRELRDVATEGEPLGARGIAAVVVTHDVALAAGVADRLYLLDPDSRRLRPLFEGEWPGPMERAGVPDQLRGEWMVRLEGELVERIAAGSSAAGERTRRSRLGPALGRAAEALLAPLAVAALALRLLPGQLFGRARDFGVVARRVLAQSLLRPLPFYAIVSVLIGYTVLYVISKVGGAGVRPDALVQQIGGSYVVALAPPLSAILFVAASGSATNAWLGSMGLTRQTLALEALGVDTRAYLWAPAWLALGLAYLVVAAVFALGMIAGGVILTEQYGLAGGWELLTADLVDPRPERASYATRAFFLVWVYAWGIAADVVAKGAGDKPDADAVTRGMTASVIAVTLWVVAWELVTVLVVLA